MVKFLKTFSFPSLERVVAAALAAANGLLVVQEDDLLLVQKQNLLLAQDEDLLLAQEQDKETVTRKVEDGQKQLFPRIVQGLLGCHLEHQRKV